MQKLLEDTNRDIQKLVDIQLCFVEQLSDLEAKVNRLCVKVYDLEKRKEQDNETTDRSR